MLRRKKSPDFRSSEVGISVYGIQHVLFDRPFVSSLHSGQIKTCSKATIHHLLEKKIEPGLYIKVYHSGHSCSKPDLANPWVT